MGVKLQLLLELFSFQNQRQIAQEKGWQKVALWMGFLEENLER